MPRLLALLLCALCAWEFAGAAHGRELKDISARELPPEAQDVLFRIRNGGSFAYRRDGIAFRNFERRLPPRPRGYYREYTVPTPGMKGRGARRIIAGRNGELFYTADHYRTFERIRE